MKKVYLLLSLFGFQAFAAPLSWEACVDLAAKNSADLQAAKSNLESTQYQESAAQNGLFPHVSASLTYTRNNNSAITPGAEDTTFGASVTASQNIFAGLLDLGRMNQAKGNTEAAEAVVQIAKARVSYDLKSAFAGLVYAKEFGVLTQEIIRRRTDNLRLVDLRFQSGRENKGSVFLSQAYLNQAKYDDLLANNAKRVSTANLAKAIGLDETSSLDIQGDLIIPEPQASKPNFHELSTKTPEYVQSTAQESSADAAIDIARSQFFPTLGLTGSIGRQSPEFFPTGENRWSVGLTLSLPLFDGGRDFYGTKAAVASWSAADTQRVHVRRQMLAKLEQSYATYLEANAKFKMDESFKQASSVRAEIARKRYNNGLMTFEDWDIIENDLITRQKTYLQSKRDRIIAEAAWSQAQGKGVIP